MLALAGCTNDRGRKHLKTGKAIGIDVWKQSDLKNNTYENTMRNATLEGVHDKVLIKNADAQQMLFPDGEFDVVLSNLCIHNISSKNGRDKACREIARVGKTRRNSCHLRYYVH